MNSIQTLLLYIVCWTTNVVMYFFYVGISALFMKVFGIEGDIKVVGGVLLLLTLLHNNTVEIVNERKRGEK